jgi:hypothetical protein
MYPFPASVTALTCHQPLTVGNSRAELEWKSQPHQRPRAPPMVSIARWSSVADISRAVEQARQRRRLRAGRAPRQNQDPVGRPEHRSTPGDCPRTATAGQIDRAIANVPLPKLAGHLPGAQASPLTQPKRDSLVRSLRQHEPEAFDTQDAKRGRLRIPPKALNWVCRLAIREASVVVARASTRLARSVRQPTGAEPAGRSRRRRLTEPRRDDLRWSRAQPTG